MFTVVNNNQHMFSNLNGIFIIFQIYTVAGPIGFFKGLGARVLYSTPATAICWSTYEFFKFVLTNKSKDHYRSSVPAGNINSPEKIRISIPDEHVMKSSQYIPVTSRELLSKGVHSY